MEVVKKIWPVKQEIIDKVKNGGGFTTVVAKPNKSASPEKESTSDEEEEEKNEDEYGDYGYEDTESNDSD